jgi:hypothetical protein
MWILDYNIAKNWTPKTNLEWEWYLVRTINYGDYKGLKKNTTIKHFPNVKRRLDPGN